LQDKERQLLGDAITAYQIRDVGDAVVKPGVALLSDNTAMLAILTAIAALLGFKFMASEELSVGGLVDTFLTQREAAILSGVISLPLGGPLGPAWGKTVADLLFGARWDVVD
jgi:hypothetical protein